MFQTEHDYGSRNSAKRDSVVNLARCFQKKTIDRNQKVGVTIKQVCNVAAEQFVNAETDNKGEMVVKFILLT